MSECHRRNTPRKRRNLIEIFLKKWRLVLSGASMQCTKHCVCKMHCLISFWYFYFNSGHKMCNSILYFSESFHNHFYQARPKKEAWNLARNCRIIIKLKIDLVWPPFFSFSRQSLTPDCFKITTIIPCQNIPLMIDFARHSIKLKKRPIKVVTGFHTPSPLWYMTHYCKLLESLVYFWSSFQIWVLPY